MTPAPTSQQLPSPRGSVSSAVFRALLLPPDEPPGDALIDEAATAAGRLVDSGPTVLDDEDLQITLHACYELHYRGFQGVDDGWEWAPALIGLRRTLERLLETDLRRLATLPAEVVHEPDVPRALARLISRDDGPPLSRFLQRDADIEQFREFVVHRSVYQLKEADPHSWGIPRLTGRVKAALVEIQADEYGGGRPERMHSELFRRTMRVLGLDDSYGAYVDAVPAGTLASTNAMSLFGLQRRLLPALVGHLAAFEMTSSIPNRRYGNGLRRLGFGRDATWFYDEHVTADAVHEQIAAHDLCGGLAVSEPAARADILFGAACALALDARLAAHVLRRWGRGESSLRDQRSLACA